MAGLNRKLGLEALEGRDMPSLFAALPNLVVYPPQDPTAPVSTVPAAPSTTPTDPGTIVVTPPPSPILPGQ